MPEFFCCHVPSALMMSKVFCWKLWQHHIALLLKQRKGTERLQKKDVCSSTTIYISAHVPPLGQECVLE